jgi:hypothetical protein
VTDRVHNMTDRTKRAASALGVAWLAFVALTGCHHTGTVLKGVPGPAIASQAMTDLETASSVHVHGTVINEGVSVTLDLTVSKSGCTGVVQQGTSGGYQITAIGQDVWIKPDEKFLLRLISKPSGQREATGQWIHTTKSAGALGAMAGICDIDDTVGRIAGHDSGIATHTSAATVDGQRAIHLTAISGEGSLDVSDTSHPVPLRLTESDIASGGTIQFDHYGADVALTPPSDNVIQANRLGIQ